MQYFHQQCYPKDDEQISTVLSTYYMSEVFSVVSNFFYLILQMWDPRLFTPCPCACVCVCVSVCVCVRLWCELVGNGLLSKDVGCMT